jgi:hypothetical protein
MFLCFVGACQRILLARFGRKTDGHTKRIRMYFKFFVFFFAYRQGLNGCRLPLFFFGFCERGQILSGIAK